MGRGSGSGQGGVAWGGGVWGLGRGWEYRSGLRKKMNKYVKNNMYLNICLEHFHFTYKCF